MNPLLKEVLESATPIVGLLIAWALFRLRARDTKTAEANLRLAKFKERLKVFDALTDLLQIWGRWFDKGRIDIARVSRDLQQFKLAIVPAPFLFGKEENNYLQSVIKRTSHLVALNDEMQNENDDARRIELSDRALELHKWLHQATEEAEHIFMKSMSVR